MLLTHFRLSYVPARACFPVLISCFLPNIQGTSGAYESTFRRDDREYIGLPYVCTLPLATAQ